MVQTDEDVVDSVRAALISHFGHSPDSASVSFVGVESISVLRFHESDVVVYVTAGMSKSPMPDANSLTVTERSGDGPRAELLLRVRVGSVGVNEVWRRLALFGAAPAVEGLRYADGALVALGEPLVPGSRARGIVVTESGVDISAAVPDVTVFQVVPATSDELAWARVHGVPALRRRWLDQDADLTDLGRVQADLA